MKNTTETSFSRRRVLRAGVAAAVGMSATTVAVAEEQKFAQAAEKVAQSVVQYQATPKDGNKCSLCVNFQPPNACQVVAGTISPDGWCAAFAPKAS